MNNLPVSQLNMPMQNQQQIGSAHQYGSYGFDHNMGHEEEAAFDPLRLFMFVIKYRLLILSFLLTSVICGFIFTSLQTPLYKATTKVEILSSNVKVFQELETVSQSTDSRAYETARERMKSRDLARRVAFVLNLSENSDFIAPTPSFSFGNLIKKILGISSQVDINSWSPEKRLRRAVDIIQNNTSVSLIRNTSILSVSFFHTDAELTSQIVNQISKSYIDQGIDTKGETSELARQFVEQQVKETKLDLQKSEKALVEYAEQEGIIITNDDVSLISANLVEINKALTEAVQERLSQERLVKQINDGQSASLPAVFESDSIQKTKLTIAELRATYQQKLGTLKPGFPEMRRLQAQINELRKQVNTEVSAIARAAKIKYDQLVTKEESLKAQLSRLDEEQVIFQKKNIKYTILKREVDSNRKQYDSLITKLSDAGIGSELKSTNASIVDLGIVPLAPYSPNLLFNLVGFISIFSILAVATMYILELMNNTFAVPDQIEEELGIPILGIIPLVDDPMTGDITSELSEAYRTLRTSIQFTGTDRTQKTILVTSTEPSEAKTTTIFKIAEAYAALNRKVLIIDADLRKPRIHKLFDMENGIGLSNLLTNVVKQEGVSEVFRQTKYPNISLLSAGTIPPNPSELLISNKMGLTIHFCSKKYDLVLIDSPPVMGLSDAPILSRLVDATLYVVSSNQVMRKSAKNAIGRLRSAGANVIGAAMTKLDVNKLSYNSYGYKYLQNNYYSYGITEEKSSPLGKLIGGTTSDDNASESLVSSLYKRIRKNA